MHLRLMKDAALMSYKIQRLSRGLLRHLARSAFVSTALLTSVVGQTPSPNVAARPQVLQAQSQTQSCTLPQWTTIDAPSPENSAIVGGIAVVSPTDIWVVGNTYPGCNGSTVIDHWDGSQWRLVPSPNPGSSNQLMAVSASSANDVWAVGNVTIGSSQRSLVLHWNGTNWSEVSVPVGGTYNGLSDVVALSANDVWAVGQAGTQQVGCGSTTPGRSQPYAIHYNGSVWSIVDVPPVYTGPFDPSRHPNQGSTLSTLSAAGPADIWAIGSALDFVNSNNQIRRNLAMHWNGSVWESVADPPVTGWPVALPGAELWLAGSSSDFMHTAMLRWNGSGWQSVDAPDVGSLRGISALAPNNMWALGNNGLLHWNGSSWVASQGGSPISLASGGFVALSDQEMWMVGADRLGDGTFKPRIARYSCQVLAPPPTATATSLPTATASSTTVPTVPTMQIPGTSMRTFVETGKTVNGLFLDYWDQNGGLSQQGYPISSVLGEVSDLDHKPYTVQYFERAVFEYHPENKSPYDVLLSQLGTFQYKKKYPAGALNQKPNDTDGSVLFPETDHWVGGKFLNYWKSHGGVAQQGYPISDEFVEKSDLNGKEYLVQYFERAVFEYHPENQPPYDVLLSQLGTFQYKQKYDGK
jgi:hypothetical protein